MDPNACLARLRLALIEAGPGLDDRENYASPGSVQDAAFDAADAAADLVEWLDRGGFLPAAWTPTAAPTSEPASLARLRHALADLDRADARGDDGLDADRYAHAVANVARDLVAADQLEIRDEDSGIVYEPWSNGWSVGFRCVAPDGAVDYVYLNPSGGGEPALGTVFAYQGPEGDAGADDALCHFVVHDDRDDEPTCGDCGGPLDTTTDAEHAACPACSARLAAGE